MTRRELLGQVNALLDERGRAGDRYAEALLRVAARRVAGEPGAVAGSDLLVLAAAVRDAGARGRSAAHDAEVLLLLVGRFLAGEADAVARSDWLVLAAALR